MKGLLFLLAALILFGVDLLAVAASTSTVAPSIKRRMARHLRDLPSVSCQVPNMFRGTGSGTSGTGDDAIVAECLGPQTFEQLLPAPMAQRVPSVKNPPQKKWLLHRAILR